jgi:membrane protein DedA with SNARE-associated domain
MSLEFISLEKIQEIAQQYGYWAVFLGILLENIGVPIPGETITLAGGFLAGSDQLNYWLVLADAVLGAILGGTIGYWVGRWGGWPLLLSIGRLFRFQEHQLAALRSQVSQNAAKTVFLGRFVALLRVFASPLAGIVEMPYPRFMLFNTLGAIAWASVMVTLSYVAGQFVPLEKLVAWASQFAALTLVIITVLIVVPFWLESRKAKHELASVQPSVQPSVQAPVQPITQPITQPIAQPIAQPSVEEGPTAD